MSLIYFIVNYFIYTPYCLWTVKRCKFNYLIKVSPLDGSLYSVNQLNLISCNKQCVVTSKKKLTIYYGKKNTSEQWVLFQVIQSRMPVMIFYHFFQSLLSLKECIADSEGAWVRGVLEPLCLVGRGSSSGGNSSAPLLLLVDGLCEAEYHRPDSGHTLASFLAAHVHHAPPWLKFVLTVRTHMDELLPPMPFHYVRYFYIYNCIWSGCFFL